MKFSSKAAAVGALLAGHVVAKTCVVPVGGQGVDDSVALNAMMNTTDCSQDAVVVFEAEKTYNLSTPVQFGSLKNVAIQILGTLEMPRDIPCKLPLQDRAGARKALTLSDVQSIVNASGGNLHWFSVAGDNVTIEGSTDPDQGWINWHGWNWWKEAATTQPLGGLANRPHNWQMNINNSTVRYVKVRQPIAWGFSLSGDNNHLYGNRVDAAYDFDQPQYFPFNTDGYDVSGNNILIEDGYVFNGDDLNKGSNITVRNMVCIGGHGASVSASTGVSNVLFDNITSINCLYATRFKSALDKTGNVSDVTWSNIHVINATFPIFATGVYFDQNTNRGRTPGVYPANSTATHITNFSWVNISGTINDVHPGDGSCVTDPCWYYVANVTNNAAITLQLLNQTARGVSVRNVDLRPLDGQGEADVYCTPESFIDGTSGLGFKCASGPYIVD